MRVNALFFFYLFMTVPLMYSKQFLRHGFNAKPIHFKHPEIKNDVINFYLCLYNIIIIIIKLKIISIR